MSQEAVYSYDDANVAEGWEELEAPAEECKLCRICKITGAAVIAFAVLTVAVLIKSPKARTRAKNLVKRLFRRG